MPMQPPKPTVPTSLPIYFMVSKSAKHGTTCSALICSSSGHALQPSSTTRSTEPASHQMHDFVCVHMCPDRADSMLNKQV